MSKTNVSNKTASLEAVARFIIDEAARRGATDCEVSIETSEAVNTTVRLGLVEQLEGAQSRQISLRAFVGQKSATTTSSDFRRPALRRLVKETIALANASEADPFAGLAEARQLAKSGGVADLGLFDPAIPALPVQTKIALALAAEAAARNADPRITNSDGASFSDEGGITVYGNSRGFVGSYPSNYCSLSVATIASTDDEMQVDAWQSVSRTLEGLQSPEAVGTMAAQRALSRLGARTVPSQVVPVVFDPHMAAQLLRQLVSAAVGTSIDRKSSFLVGKLGQVVASNLVTIIDDPLMPGGLASKPFDGEGLPLTRRVIVEAGKLLTYLVSAYAARKLGCEPNSGSTGNLYLQAGEQTPEQIIASISNGLYVTNVTGQGFNPVTGDYSRGASGMWIENGRLAYPVSGIAIASDVLTMFAGITAVGSDLEFRAGTNAPTILIDQMTVAGQ